MGINRAERSLGLIDGVYAVSVTLMAIDLPKIILPFLRSGNLFSIEPMAYVAVYVFQFLIIYDMWMIHKNISMTENKAFSKKTEFISMVVMGLVILSPGIIGDSFEIFERNLDFQSTELNLTKLFLYFYFMIIYGLLILMDVSKGNKKTTLSFIMNGVLFRFLFFLAVFVTSLVTFDFGWVLPVPVTVLVMVILKTLLSHPEYEMNDNK
jgi:uncharacterized membrane protein